MSLLAGPVAVSDEKDWFHLPGVGDVRIQRVERQPGETNWPFTVDAGMVTCAIAMGQRMPMFFEDLGDADQDETSEFHGAAPRGVILSTNPFDLVFMNMANRDLLDIGSDIGAAISRIAPWVELGKRLCDQPGGSQIGPRET